jgi:hypothetical protein
MEFRGRQQDGFRDHRPVESELNVRTDSGNVTVDSVHGDMTFDTVGANLATHRRERLHGGQDDRRLAGLQSLLGKAGSQFDQRQRADDSALAGQRARANLFREHLFDGSFSSRGIYIMKNFSGTIEVHFSSSDSFDVNANSLKGDVINQASFKPDTHGTPRPASKWGHGFFGTMNEGHAKVELSSFSGTIKILKRD